MHRNLFVSVRREILDLCDSTVAPLEFIRSAGHLLTRAVPCEVWAMHAVDPSTLLPGGGVPNGFSFPRDAAWEIAKREFLDGDVNVFSDLARSPTNAGSLQLATGGVPQASLRFRNLLRTIKISDELRATYVANSACWGISTFLRTRGSFSPTEVDFVSSLSSPIGSALRRLIWLGMAVKAPRFAPAIVVLDARDQIEETSPEAASWLEQLKVIGPEVERTLPLVVTIVAQQTRRPVLEPLAGGDFRRVRTLDGTWVSLRTARLHNRQGRDDRVAVVIDPAPRDEIADFLLTGYRLSARERQIAVLLARGRDAKDIAHLLHLSPHTVRDHVKKVFEKVEVHAQAELIAKLFVDSAPLRA